MFDGGFEKLSFLSRQYTVAVCKQAHNNKDRMASATSLYVNWAEERVKSKEVVDGTTCRDELMQTEIQKVGCFIYIPV